METPVDEVKAQKVSLIEEIWVRVEVDTQWYQYDSRDPESMRRYNSHLRHNANEVLDTLNMLKGIKAQIVTEETQYCTACHNGFEMDPETGLTACCGREAAQ
jgi:hypothetical protein